MKKYLIILLALFSMSVCAQNIETEVWKALEIMEDKPQDAFKVFKKYADKGDATAQYGLGALYYNGLIGEKDGVRNYEEAVKWFRKSAEQGLQNSQYVLASCLEVGKGTAMNVEEAAEWYSKAAAQGNEDAKDKLALLRHKLKDVGKLSNIAEGGHTGAQYEMGMRYLKGKGVKKNLPEAVRLLTEAANHGDAEAQYELALCYMKGKGVQKNKDEVLKWLTAAGLQGHKDAKKKLKKYGVKL